MNTSPMKRLTKQNFYYPEPMSVFKISVTHWHIVTAVISTPVSKKR